MDQERTRNLLQQVSDGLISADEALLKLRAEPFEDLGFAKLDTHRELRTGAAEVIYGGGKSPEQIAEITKSMVSGGQERILITRLDPEKEQSTRALLKGMADREDSYHYFREGRIALVGEIPRPDGIGRVLVMTAGTSDVPVAEEAAVTAQALGNEVSRLYDVGVAGLERLLGYTEEIMSASVIICIAGMEGALAAVVTGLADCPVIAVPTSVGYGTSMHGFSALFSMLNCCASGMCVENIDNGFGAGYLAGMINHMDRKMRR